MPPILEPILPHAPAFLAALSRLAGLFIFAPVFSSAMVPVKVRAFFAIALTAAVYPSIAHEGVVPLRLDLLELVPAMLTESLIGAAVGLIAGLPLMAVQLGGLIIGQQMGLGLGNVYNPATDTDTDAIGQALFFLAMGAYLAMGGLDATVRAIVLTFANVPIGGFGSADAPLALLSGLVAGGFELAVRVAAPVLCLLFIETVASGLLMKTAPQMNIMSFGFPLRITLGMAAMYASMGAAHEAMHGDIAGALNAALHWAGGLGGGGGSNG